MAASRRPRPDAVRVESASITEKGPIVSNVELPVLRKHAMDGKRRLRRVVSLVTAAALGASLLAGAAGPASAAVQEPARSAPISFASGDNALPAVALAAAARYVHVSDGRLSLDTVEGEKAGVSSQALSTESALVASWNRVLSHENVTVNSARDTRGGVVDVAAAVPAAAQDTTITLLPGITLTINSTGIQLSMTRQAVTEVENLVGFGQAVASLVGSILAISGVPLGGQIAAIVATSLGLGNSLLRLCTASDGSATFTVSWTALPSCSGLSV
jgi:hypothetical protein